MGGGGYSFTNYIAMSCHGALPIWSHFGLKTGIKDFDRFHL